ncbi:MAG: DUF1294 domain-containing protein [Clostridia bacterium]|nr:DUF1294 domain-containing protein [Clostridia bacterium]
MPYLLIINFISVIVCIFDKHRAKKGGYRVPESTLFTLCLMGGSVGMYFMMRLVRHKTRHKRFMIGIPLIIILQIAVLLVVKYVDLW